MGAGLVGSQQESNVDHIIIGNTEEYGCVQNSRMLISTSTEME
jgi:hypothetical protein